MKLDTLNLLLVAVILSAVGHAAQADPLPCDNSCRNRQIFLWNAANICNYKEIPDCLWCTGNNGVCVVNEPPQTGSCLPALAGPNQKAAGFMGCSPLCPPLANIWVEAYIAEPPNPADQGVKPDICRL